MRRQALRISIRTPKGLCSGARSLPRGFIPHRRIVPLVSLVVNSEVGEGPDLRSAACRAHGCMIGIVDAAGGQRIFYHQPQPGVRTAW